MGPLKIAEPPDREVQGGLDPALHFSKIIPGYRLANYLTA